MAGLLYFTASLAGNGFTMNLFDPCVWNKIVNRKQLTIDLHVNDCKVSHIDSKVLDETIEWLHQDYMSIFDDGSGKMKVNRGLQHKNLGMDLDYSTQGQCNVTTIDYVDKILAA
jgi:hypothetical protein